ncbi:hypothetical protein EDB87DRAFT_1728586, partial [Lactarius vividus]
SSSHPRGFCFRIVIINAIRDCCLLRHLILLNTEAKLPPQTQHLSTSSDSSSSSKHWPPRIRLRVRVFQLVSAACCARVRARPSTEARDSEPVDRLAPKTKLKNVALDCFWVYRFLVNHAQYMRAKIDHAAPPLSAAAAATTIMEKVWCLLIDHELKPTIGEPLSEWSESNGTIHDLEVTIKQGTGSRDLLRITANRMQIWKCKSLRLSANDPFRRTRKLLQNIKFSYDENNDVQHLAPAQIVKDLEPADDELLLVVVPDIGTLFLYPQ